MWGLGCKAQWLVETLSAELVSLIGAIVLICVEDRPISATHGAGKVETRCAPTCRRQGRVKCSLRSNTEPKQPNSGRSSPTYRVRRTKRGNSAISSRSTRRLPKTKNGWQSRTIQRRKNYDNRTALVKEEDQILKFLGAAVLRPFLCAGILFPRSSNGSSSTVPVPSVICSKRRRSRDG